MTELVPVLEFISRLRTAGVQVDYHTLLDRPEEYWAQLPAAGRDELVAFAGASGPEARVKEIRIVKRRARAPVVENVFVQFALEGPDARKDSWQRLFMYSPLSQADADSLPPIDDDNDVEAFGVPQSVFREATWAKSRRRVMELLDAAWGGEDNYDTERDGPLCEFKGGPHVKELERHWVEEPIAMVAILLNDTGELIYHIEEPRLTHYEKTVLLMVNDRLRDLVILEEEEHSDRAEYLAKKVFGLIKRLSALSDRRSAYKMAYYVIRNYLGFGRLDVIMRDPNIEDASCNGPHLPIYVAHGKYRNVATTLVFDELELNTFTVKLAQLGGKLLSVAQPLVDATLPDGSRIQACLGREVTNKGSAFTVRKFREDPLTAVDLIRGGTHTVDTMALLWLAVEMKRSLIVMGATASGKTTTLNCLSQFIPPTQKIVTIEDTREITLQHENWLASVTREAFTGGASERISMYDLLRAALRQRPDYLTVGEIRGEEGLTLFQAMSTGHTCFSTMHAGSVENAVHRLENAPISVPRVMLTSLDFFLVQGAVDIKGKPARRMLSLTELNGIDPVSRNLRMNDVFRWDSAADIHQYVGASRVIDEARTQQGWSRNRVDEEYAARRRVLAGLVERNERHYSDVAKEIWKYYRERDADNMPTPPATPAIAPKGTAPAPPAAGGGTEPARRSDDAQDNVQGKEK